MSNNLCKKCFFYGEPLCSYQYNTKRDVDICKYFKEIPTTVFDRITSSPEVLAKSSVYCLSSDLCRSAEGKFIVKSNWKSPFIDRCYDTEPEAISATLARLKEVEK